MKSFYLKLRPGGNAFLVDRTLRLVDRALRLVDRALRRAMANGEEVEKKSSSDGALDPPTAWAAGSAQYRAHNPAAASG
jgi:hypothetical protein